MGKPEFTRPVTHPVQQNLRFPLHALPFAMLRHSPILESTPIVELLWRNEDDTATWAARLAALPTVRDAFIELQGELGVGKTTFARHLLRALGISGRIKSPTYTVVEPHTAPDGLAISHFDFYRFTDPREWEEAGFRDLFAAPGLKLAEWPERATPSLPTPDLRMHLSMLADGTRAVRMVAPTERGARMLRELQA